MKKLSVIFILMQCNAYGMEGQEPQSTAQQIRAIQKRQEAEARAKQDRYVNESRKAEEVTSQLREAITVFIKELPDTVQQAINAEWANGSSDESSEKTYDFSPEEQDTFTLCNSLLCLNQNLDSIFVYSRVVSGDGSAVVRPIASQAIELLPLINIEHIAACSDAVEKIQADIVNASKKLRTIL